MDLEELVHRACQDDVNAFVELTRRFQHFAFGSALALLGDVHQAEDTAQEAFLAARPGLPSLSDPAAFPGWVRGIVRHHAFRALRKRQLEIVLLESAENVPSENILPDDDPVRRERAQAARAAIAGLPASLREPATLFYIHGVLAPEHRQLSEYLGNDGEQPLACRSLQIEREDANDGGRKPCRLMVCPMTSPIGSGVRSERAAM